MCYVTREAAKDSGLLLTVTHKLWGERNIDLNCITELTNEHLNSQGQEAARRR